jgi:hypothetical protein
VSPLTTGRNFLQLRFWQNFRVRQRGPGNSPIAETGWGGAVSKVSASEAIHILHRRARLRYSAASSSALQGVLPTYRLRSRANLRSRSRSASVIDRLLKNQNPLEIVIIFHRPRRTLVLDRRPGNRAAILRSEIHRHGRNGCSDRRCSVRAFTTRRRGGRRPPHSTEPGVQRVPVVLVLTWCGARFRC